MIDEYFIIIMCSQNRMGQEVSRQLRAAVHPLRNFKTAA